jgi:uncharacterized damage-inducible protein DinB
MYRRIDDFIADWKYESESTQKVFAGLTPASLPQPVTNDHRTLGRLAWHLAQTIPEMMNRTGLKVTGVDDHAPLPGSLVDIQRAYAEASKSLLSEVSSKWKDSDLEIEDNLYGDNWKRGVTLTALLMHQAHHRGQMTVLMRQAGLKVPGVYGPAKEDWVVMGMPAPAV